MYSRWVKCVCAGGGGGGGIVCEAQNNRWCELLGV